jgi:hypothetical protein
LFHCWILCLLSGNASESNFDGAVEEEFILEVDLLFKGEASNMNVEFPVEVQIEEMAVVQIET